MRISIGQIFVLIIISFLLFGDVKTLKNKSKNLFKEVEVFLKKKNRKKGNRQRRNRPTARKQQNTTW